MTINNINEGNRGRAAETGFPRIYSFLYPWWGQECIPHGYGEMPVFCFLVWSFLLSEIDRGNKSCIPAQAIQGYLRLMECVHFLSYSPGLDWSEDSGEELEELEQASPYQVAWSVREARRYERNE